MKADALGRALVIGAVHKPHDGPPSAIVDAERMGEWLTSRGFAVRMLTGTAATRDGILSAYLDLIEHAEEAEPIAIYFSGHGGLATGLVTEEDVSALLGNPPIPETFQYLVPSDYRQSTEHDFRGISSWELSLLLEGLTRKTHNVTVILDCCYSAQMSRGNAAVGESRAVELNRASARRHFESVRARSDLLGELARCASLDPMGNARAVRITACSEWQQAYTTRDARGQPTGVLTNALLAILEFVDKQPVSWRAVGEAVKRLALMHPGGQLPMVEGPVSRRPFSLSEAPGHSIQITSDGDRFVLNAGTIAGVSEGDIYSVAPLGTARLEGVQEIACATVERVTGLHATGRLVWSNGHEALPPHAIAWPSSLALPRRPVRIDVAEPTYSLLATSIRDSSRLRLAAPGEHPLAVVCERSGALVVLTDDGALHSREEAWSLQDVIDQLQDLAAAQALLELQGEGLRRDEIEIEWGTAHGQMRLPRPILGTPVSKGDRFYARVRNRSKQVLRVHVFSIGLRGNITRLSGAAARGIELGIGEQAFVGAVAHPKPSFGLSWPKGVPTDAPRTDRLVILVTTAPADLGVLETPPREAKAQASKDLEQWPAQLHEDGERGHDPEAKDPFLAVHCSWMLHPLSGPIAQGHFAADEDRGNAHGGSAPPARLGTTAGEELAPEKQIEVRICDVAVERAMRIDALICTRSVDGRRVYEARTLRVAAGTRGEGVLWRGAVRDLVEVYLWAAADPGESRELAALMAEAGGSGERAAWIEEAVEKLVIVDERAPWALAAGACAALANIAEEQLRRIAPGVAGLVHASYVAAEGYGVGRGRSYRGLGVALRLEITEIEEKA